MKEQELYLPREVAEEACEQLLNEGAVSLEGENYRLRLMTE